jgi:hypothetical protein
MQLNRSGRREGGTMRRRGDFSREQNIRHKIEAVSKHPGSVDSSQGIMEGSEKTNGLQSKNQKDRIVYVIIIQSPIKYD